MGEIVGARLETISKDASFREATQRIRRTGLRRLPVVDRKGKLFGIITSDDLMHVAVAELSQLGSALDAQAPFERVVARAEGG